MPGTIAGGQLDRIEAEIRALQQQAQLTQRSVQHWQSHDAADATVALLSPLGARPDWATPQALDAAMLSVVLVLAFGAGLLGRRGWHRLRIPLARPSWRRPPTQVAPAAVSRPAAPPAVARASQRAVVAMAPPLAWVDHPIVRPPQLAPRVLPPQPAPRPLPPATSVREFGTARVPAAARSRPLPALVDRRSLRPAPAAAEAPPVVPAPAPVAEAAFDQTGSRSPMASGSFSFDPQAAATEVMRVRKSLADKRDARLQSAAGEEERPGERPGAAVAKLAPPEAPAPGEASPLSVLCAPAGVVDFEIEPAVQAPPSAARPLLVPAVLLPEADAERDYAVTMELAEASAALALWEEARELAYEVLEDGSAPLRKRARQLLQQLMAGEPLRAAA